MVLKKIEKKKKVQKSATSKMNGRPRKLFVEYLELKGQEALVQKRLELIKKEVKEEIITGDEGFIVCNKNTGEGFRKCCGSRSVLNEEKLKKALSQDQFKMVTKVIRVFVPEKIEEAILEGHVQRQLVQKCCDVQKVFSLRIGKEQEEEG